MRTMRLVLYRVIPLGEQGPLHNWTVQATFRTSKKVERGLCLDRWSGRPIYKPRDYFCDYTFNIALTVAAKLNDVHEKVICCTLFQQCVNDEFLSQIETL